MAASALHALHVVLAVLHFDTPEAEPLGRVTITRLRELAEEGHFASGSMGPKVEAAARFVEGGGARAAIGALADIEQIVAGTAGTNVVPG